MSTTINANIQLWRQKALDGTLTLEETREAIAAIRKERADAGVKSTATKKATKAAAKPNGDDLLSQLGEL